MAAQQLQESSIRRPQRARFPLLVVLVSSVCSIQVSGTLNGTANLSADLAANLSYLENKTILNLGVLGIAGSAGEILSGFIQKYLNSPNRTLLPDYAILLDSISFDTLDSGSAAGAFVKGIRPTSKGYVGIAGPVYPPHVLETVILSAAANVLQVHTSDDPALSDQRKYPYQVRVWRSMETITRGYFHIAASNGWTKMLSIWTTPGEIDAATRSANASNVMSFAFLFGTEDEEWQYGSQLHVDIERVIQQERMRSLAMYDVVDIAKIYDTMCYLTIGARLQGFQLFMTTRLPGWWLTPPPRALGTCTAGEMSEAVFGYLLVAHVPLAPGGNALGTLHVPPIPNDQSKEPLTCSPDITPDYFVNSPEHISHALMSGVPADANLLTYLVGSAPIYDCICAILVGLHHLLYTLGVPLEQLLAREDEAYELFVDSVRGGSFQGAQGALSFYPGTGDPKDIYHVLGQLAVPWKPVDSLDTDGIIQFPLGLNGEPVVTVFPNSTIQWRDGSTGFASKKPHLDLFPVCAEENAILVGDSCEACSQGHYFDALLRSCRRCEEGSYQTLTGRSTCVVAQPGTFVANPDSPVEAIPCLRGHRCPQAGMVLPEGCGLGQFADATGSSGCELCPRGQFQSRIGQVGCQSCELELAGSTTASVRSESPQDCICPEGTFLPLNAVGCAPCPEGMTCPLGSNMSADPRGSSYPRLKPQHMSLLSEPLKVYKCLEGTACPGGPPGTCAAFHDATAVACGECESDAYETQGECSECDGFAVLPLVAAGAAAVLAIVAITIATNRNLHNTPASSFTVVALAGLLFTALQTIGVFNQMAIDWVEPLESILNTMSLLSFDVKMLKVSCVMGSGHIRSFIARQAVAPLCIPFILIALLVKKHSPLFGGHGDTRMRVEFTNTVGSVFNLFFISIVISAFSPLICYDHPGSSGSSVLSAPSILCFEDDNHTYLMIIGVVALVIVPLPFLCLCAYGIWQYPMAILREHSAKFVHAMRFLFIRFVPQRYYFGIVILIRSLCLCLVPVILGGEVPLQIIALSCIVYLYALIREACHPWRGSVCNILDGAMHILLGLMLTCTALFVEEDVDAELMGALATAVLFAILGSLAIGLILALKGRFIVRKFDFFICHHKAHAAAQARLLKIILEQKKNVSVFIDSDNLRELDGLFDIVKSQLRHLVVYLTSETLRRPWCAGEVVTAVRKKLKITPVRCSSFEPPTDQELERPETYLDMSGCNLHEYSISLKDVAAAIEALMDMPSLEPDAGLLGRSRFDQLCRTLLGQANQGNNARRMSSANLGPAAGGGIAISCLDGSDEAVACGVILLVGLSAKVLGITDKGIYLSSDQGKDVSRHLEAAKMSRAVLIVLTPGTMTSPSQVSIMLELESMREQARRSRPAPTHLSVATPGFEYPGKDYYEEILPALPGLPSFSHSEMAKLMRQFFKSISVFLPSHGSQPSIDTAVDAIFQRIRKGFGATLGSHGSSASGPATGSGLKVASTGSDNNNNNCVEESNTNRTESECEGAVEWADFW